ncbi:MAG: prephenate dehydrogenase [Candidatus Coproplasma sp.]
MKICIVGLGLIGGSMAMALKRAGYKVDGSNRSPKPLQYALDNNIIDGAATSFETYDVVFVALPPQATVNFILTTPFKKGAIVADICGVKRLIEREVYSANLPVSYVGMHPMAGKEVTGIENACEDLFDRASMVITHGERTDEESVTVIKELVKAMGFKYLVECSAELHDRKIAYTSQLAHVVSNAYVNDEEIEGCLGFTGGSFQDMTRIAGVDENAWASLYLDNADNLLQKCNNLISCLQGFAMELEDAKNSGSTQKLAKYLSVGATAYRNGKAENFVGEGITVTGLK